MVFFCKMILKRKDGGNRNAVSTDGRAANVKKNGKKAGQRKN